MELKDHACNQRDQSVKEKTSGRDANKKTNSKNKICKPRTRDSTSRVDPM